MKDYIESLESLSKKQLVLMLARQRLEESHGIAVVGISCRLPGSIDDAETFWQALLKGRVIVEEGLGVPTDSMGRPRWNLAAPDLAPLADLLARGAYLSDVDLFDAERFGVSSEEATYMDPQQRVLLTCAAQALADAGLSDPARLRVGVFAGVSIVEYNFAGLRNGVNVEDLSPYMGTGSALSATAARVAVGLRLNGPVLTVDTACSSALTAVHLATMSLRRRECDVAIVGACHLLLSPFTTAVFARAGMLSPTGRSRPFAADADGHVRGEGCGVLVLKRYQDARADGDRPYALIRGSAVYQHGDRSVMSVSSAVGQKRVMEQALRDVDVDPHHVQYVEAQANGARLAGVIELETLAEVYGRFDPESPPLYVGSCKANLGYLETASGAASFIKTALALHHREIPPQPGHDELDPAIPWDRVSVQVPREATPWPDTQRRMAAVSSFGFTGTNAHVLLEAIPDPAPRDSRPRDAPAGKHYWPASNVWS